MPRLLAAALVLLVVSAALYPRLAFDREGWLADYALLKRHMGVAYANLDWMREHRGIDTQALDCRTSEALHAARTNREARKALQAFLAAFDDPHLRVERHPPRWWVRLSGLWRDAGVEREEDVARAASGDQACRALGYENIDPGFGLAVEALPDWRSEAGPPFPAGTFRLPADRTAALLRIAEFGEQKYRDVCVAAWNAAMRATPEPCGAGCQDSFRSVVLDSLTARVGSLAGALRRAGAEALVVDLTGNGGGSEWSSAVAAILAGRPLRAGPTGFVKHPHWTDRLREEVARADPEARSSIEAALAAAEVVCDRRFLWLGGEGLPTCRQVVIAELPPEEIPLEGEDPRTRWTGELWILVDGGTASAAEEVPALLADNGAARIIGEATFGAGCGYTHGGIPAELPHSGLTVWMPDCARYRRNGTNEIEGVRPHVALAWSEMNGEARARALAAALAR
jgi:hypothetical protein